MTNRQRNATNTLAGLLSVGGEPWSTAQVAKCLHCTTRSVVQMIKQGDLLAVKLSGAYVVFAWQFDPRTGEISVPVKSVVKILRERPKFKTETIIVWLLRPLRGGERSRNRLDALTSSDTSYVSLERAARRARPPR